MTGKEYKYNGRIWHIQPTTQGRDSFFHAVFGEGTPCFDKDAYFRRKCLSNFLTYFETTSKSESLKQWLEKTLNVNESDNNYSLCYKSFIDKLKEYEINLNEIPIIAALENTIIVVFVEDKEVPEIFEPEENFLINYPWKVRTDMKEVVICLHDNDYTRLLLDSHEEICRDPLEESVEEENEEDNIFPIKNTYPKLPGSAGIRGSLYQINLLTIFLLNATKSGDAWRLSTENMNAGKFDDLVFEIVFNNSYLLQAKYRKTKKVTYDELYSTNSKTDDFSLPKYYLSYQQIKDKFSIKKMILCTNTDLRLPKEPCPEIEETLLKADNPLYFTDVKSRCYTFTDAIIPRLMEKVKEYKDNNLKDQYFNGDIFSDNQVKTFLSMLQLVTGYPNEGDLDTVIEGILDEKKYCDRFETKGCSKYLKDKMMDWFEHPKGEYLTQNSLRIFLSEFRSNKLCEKLRSFQVHIAGDIFCYRDAKKILFIESRKGYVLNMIKVYCTLYSTNKKCLFLSPNENIQTQKDMVQAFKESKYDTLVASFKVPDIKLAEEISDSLTSLLRSYSYKRIILITGRSDPLVKMLKERNKSDYDEVFENISFNDLTEESQTGLLKRVVQFFHASI